MDRVSATPAVKRSSKQKDVPYINQDVDYFGRSDVVREVTDRLNYVPLALRDTPSLITLNAKHHEVLCLDKQKCEMALAETRKKKDRDMKKVLRVKEANSIFYTQNPLSPPYYYPKKDNYDDANSKYAIGSTQDSSSPDGDTPDKKKEITPRTQAKIDHKLLFGEEIVPVPAHQNMVKRALKERKEREMKEKGLKEDPSILR